MQWGVNTAFCCNWRASKGTGWVIAPLVYMSKDSLLKLVRNNESLLYSGEFIRQNLRNQAFCVLHREFDDDDDNACHFWLFPVSSTYSGVF